MAVTQAEFQKQLADALQEVSASQVGTDSAVAYIDSLEVQLAEAIKNSADLTEASASVAQIMAGHRAQAQQIADAMATAPTP